MNELVERIKKHVVMVEQGSGVLVQPNSIEFSYILTAKHVVKDCDDINNIIVKNIQETEVTVIDIIKHQTLDIAILKVNFQEGLEVLLFEECLELDTNIDLYGYPANERNNNLNCYNQINRYSLKVHDIKHDELIFRNDSFADESDVEGYSGSGLFYVVDNILYIVGIENEMTSVNDNNNNISGIPIERYKDLLVSNSWLGVNPIFFSSLKHLENKIFLKLNLENPDNLEKFNIFFKKLILDNRIYLSDFLKPYNIMENHGMKLVSSNQDYKIFYESKLWVFLLEFISVFLCLKELNCEEERWDEKFINEIFDNYRFVFSNESIGHRSIFRKLILSTNFSSLNEKSKIICFVNGDAPSDFKIPKDISRQTLTNITSGLRTEDIYCVQTNMQLKNDIIHWNSLNDLCLASDDVFSEYCLIIQSEEILNILRERYKINLLEETK